MKQVEEYAPHQKGQITDQTGKAFFLTQGTQTNDKDSYYYYYYSNITNTYILKYQTSIPEAIHRIV